MMEAARQRWNDLSPRERVIIIGGGLVLAAGLVFAFVLAPLLDQMRLLDRQHVRKGRDYEELVRLESQFRQVQGRLAALEQRLAQGSGQFSLLPFLEETAVNTGIRNLIVAMQPQPTVPLAGYQETAVEIRLDGMQLQQLLALVAAVESAPGLVQVKRLQITPRYDSPHLLQVTIRVASYAKA